MTRFQSSPLALIVLALALPGCERPDDDDDGHVAETANTEECSSEETGADSSSTSGGGGPLGSCLEILTADPTSASGVYTLADSIGGFYDVYCDMDTDGGGWTLVMKAASELTTFHADASYWEDEVLFNEFDLLPNTVPSGDDAKYRSFVDVGGTELRLEFVEPDVDFIHDTLGGATPLQLFSGPEDLIAGSEADACHGDLLSTAPNYDATIMAHGQGHQFYGINGSDSGPASSGAMRFGFGSNDEDTGPWGPRMGIGAAGTTAQFSLRWRSQTDCSAGDCGCYGTELNVDVTSGNLWVR